MSAVLAAVEAFIRDQYGTQDDAWLKRNYRLSYEMLTAARETEQAGDIPAVNVVREQLITQLEGRRDLILAEYDDAGKKLDDADLARTNLTDAVSSWFGDIADGVAAGVFEVTSGGSVIQKDGGPVVPEKPNGARSEASVKEGRVKLATERAAAVAAIEAQLQLLRIGSDKNIAVTGASVKALLNTPVPQGLNY